MSSNNPVKRFKLQAGFSVLTGIKGIEYEDDELQIYASGLVYLKSGLCSDGCSPTWRVKHFGVIGPWNGPININTNLPITARAFFLHDALLERRKELGISTAVIHKAFCDQMMVTDFILKRLYCFLATKYGPQD